MCPDLCEKNQDMILSFLMLSCGPSALAFRDGSLFHRERQVPEYSINGIRLFKFSEFLESGISKFGFDSSTSEFDEGT